MSLHWCGHWLTLGQSQPLVFRLEVQGKAQSTAVPLAPPPSHAAHLSILDGVGKKWVSHAAGEARRSLTYFHFPPWEMLPTS